MRHALPRRATRATPRGASRARGAARARRAALRRAAKSGSQIHRRQKFAVLVDALNPPCVDGILIYPPGIDRTGIDLSHRMLARARARELGADVCLEHADVERLPFADASFDTVTATCVFCSVDDPVCGLEEVRRVVKPEGRVLLVEHVRPRNRLLGVLFDLLTPLTRRLIGPEINRRTEDSIRRAGLELVEVRRDGIWREIVARPGQRGVAGAPA